MPVDKPYNIPLDQIVWDKIGEKRESDRLLAVLNVGPLSMHLEAIAVTRSEGGENVAVDPDWVDDIEALEDMSRGSFTTLEIEGQEYVLIATPFCH